VLEIKAHKRCEERFQTSILINTVTTVCPTKDIGGEFDTN